MGPYKRSTATLTLGLLLSAAAHLGAGLALLALPPRPERLLRAEPPEDRTPLGIDRSRHVTLTWVGFEEPTPHEARKSETVQSQETPNAGAPTARPEPGPAPPENEAQPAPTERAEPVDAAPRPDALSQPAPEDAQDEPPAERQPDPAPPTPAATPDTGLPGIESDRETVATSVDDPMEIDPGKPAAREGLRIITRYIKWPETLVGRPRSPVVEVWFGTDGKPKDVRYARDPESGRVLDTGSHDIDEILRTEIYRWRAEGDAIDDLGAGERLKIVLRILM